MKRGFSLHTAVFSLMAIVLSACIPDLFPGKAHFSVTSPVQDAPYIKEVETYLSQRAASILLAKRDETMEAEKIAAELTRKMISLGYYDASVIYQPADRPWSGSYAITSGEAYKISVVDITPDAHRGFQDKIGIAAGDILDASSVLAAQERLKKSVAVGKCFFTLSADHAVVLDHQNKTASLTFTVEAGMPAKTGVLTFDGNGSVSLSYLRKLAAWREGDCFSHRKIETLRASLFETGLFAAADLVLPEKPLEDGTVPVTLRLKERAHRSVRLGATYYTDEGLGATIGWQHRNFLGSAESLSADLSLSQKNQTLKTRLTKPFFLRRDQSLSFNANLGREDSDAYIESGIDGGVSLHRSFTKRLSGSTGVNLSLSRIEDKASRDKNNFALVSLPQTLVYDSRDSALDPVRGWYLDGLVEPFFDVAGETSPFWKTSLGARTYYSLHERMTLAFRAKAGSIIGPSTINLPASQRFYAGGGGSVRGFGYQKVGPQKNGDPQGGRAVAELSSEARIKMTDTIGGVIFVDAGSVTDKAYPDFDNLSVGAGAGLRYYTDFGPLRLDVGVPLNNRDDTSSYQVYISIGQAF